MEKVINEIVKYTLEFRQIAGNFFAPPRLYIFQLVSLILSGVLVWGIIYTISRTGWINRKIEYWMDYLGVGDVGKRRQLVAWKQIVKRMKTGEVSNWKLAIMEADKLLDEILKTSGLKAATAEERFKQLTPESVSNFAQLQEAHRARNRVAQEPDFNITKDEVLSVLKVYKTAFQEFGLLD